MKLVQRVRVLETAAKSGGAPQAQGELQAKCALLMKERDAMCTIMEQKIKLLVSNISQAVGVILQNDRGDGSSNSPSRALTQVSELHGEVVVCTDYTVIGCGCSAAAGEPLSDGSEVRGLQ